MFLNKILLKLAHAFLIPNSRLHFIKNRDSLKMSKNKEFVSRRNPVTGKMEWELVPEDYDYLQEIGRAAYADMLHDHDRNEKYEIGLKWAISKTKSQGKEAIVLDIGTGTGLLSMMAKRAGADQVFACEAFNPMLECAKNVIKRNGFTESDIKLIPKRSTELVVGVDIPLTKCNILVTEVFDTELIGEGAISTYNHAKEFLMQPGYLAVPMTSTVYIQYAESDEVTKFHTLGSKYLDLDKTKLCNGVPSVHDLQLSNLNNFKLLSPPIPAFEFNFMETLAESRRTILQNPNKEANNNNTTAAFLYWTLAMDENGTEISCEPSWLDENKKYSWRDHWMQAVYYLPPNINKSVFNHDEFSFWFGENSTHPVCSCGVHQRLSRNRIYQINSESSYDLILQAVSETDSTNTICCISDDTLLPFELAGKFPHKKIINWGENSLAKHSTDKSITFTETIPETNEEIVVVGDPYFTTSLNQWDHLKFFYQAGQLKNVKAVFPNKCVVSIVAAEFEHLWKIKAPVHQTCGIDLTDFDKLIMSTLDQTDSEIDAQPIWEYTNTQTSSHHPVLEFEYPIQKDQHSVGELKLNGKTNAVIIYTEWFVNGTIIKKQFDNNLWEKKNHGVVFVENVQDVLKFDVNFIAESGLVKFSFE